MHLALAIAAGLPAAAAAQTVLPSTVSVPWGPNETLYESFAQVVPGTSYAVRLAFSGPYPTDTVQGLQTWKMWYQVLNPSTGQMDTIRPLIQSGAGYSQTHPISPVYIEPPTRQNSFFPSASPPTLLSNGQVAVPFGYWKLIGNTLEHASDAYTFTRAGVLLGTWNSAHSDLSWSVGLTSGLDFSAQSRRGEIEPSFVELDLPGRLLMSIRGSNEGNTSLPGRAWKAISNDYGQTWSATSTLSYSDGSSFYSPSAMSTVIRNSANQKVYWLGNIVGSNPNDDLPRYPLVIGQIDQSTLGIIKSSVQTIADRDPATQTTSLQYSNFSVTESPLTGQFAIAVPVEDNGVTTHQIFLSNLPITKVEPTPVSDSTAWKLRYEGNVLPTQAGAIQYSNGSTGQLITRYGNPSTGTDGSVLHLSTPTVGAALLAADTKVPFSTGSTLKLDPAVGYTIEFRAQLNSITGTEMMVGGATVQIPNGTTGGNAYTISLIDPNGSNAGKAVAWAGATTQTAFSIPDGFNTYRLTVKDTVAKLYVDGILLDTDVSGGNRASPTYEMRIGDFTDSAGANWDLDYFRVYDLGAVAPITPPSTWVTNGSDNWNASANWTSVSPNGVDAVANLRGAITAPRTVVADSPVTVGTLKFDNANGYQLAGQGSLTIQTSTGNGAVSVLQGGHKINLPLFFASNTDVSVASGATLTIGNPTTIKAGKTVTKSGNLLIQAPLAIEAGGALVLASGPTTTFGAPSLASGAKIDVKSNSMTVDYRGQASPAATIKAQLTSGYASGAWNGQGINTSSAVANQTALGWKDDGANQSIRVKYTYYGDANLDGQVDISDLGALATAWQTSAVWSQGDFDYSGFVDISDLGKLATNWQLGVGSPLGPSFDEALASLGLAGVSVPEPTATLGLAALGALGLTRRRGRRRHRTGT